MDLAEIRARIQAEYGDLNQAQLVQARINAWINSAQLDIVRKTNCLATSSNVVFSIGAVNAALPATFLKFLHAGFTSGGAYYKLKYIEFEELMRVEFPNSLTPVGLPTKVYIRPEFSVIGLYPLPESAITVVLDHTKIPATLTSDSDVPEIPLAYHEVIHLYALMRAAKLDNDLERAQMYDSEYVQRVGEIQSDSANPSGQSYPVVKGTDDVEYYGVYSW